jgi:hypothetical protein
VILVDAGTAFTVIMALVVITSLIYRSNYRRKHPPLTTEEKNRQLERELAEINKEIEE